MQSMIILVILTCWGCGDEADIPAYIKVNAPQFDVLPNQGTDFQNSDFYFLYHRNAALGGFAYGNEVPVLAEGVEDITIYPGVRMDGFQAMPEINFMFNPVVYSRDFMPGSDYEFSPTFTYNNDVNFRIVEDFETGNSFNVDVDGDPAAKMTVEPGIGYDGSQGGIMRATPDQNLVAVAYDIPFTNFPLGLPVIIEMSHNNSTQLAVSIWANYAANPSQEFPKIYLVPTDGEWKKLYLDVGDLIRSTNAQSIQLMYSIRYDEQVDDNYAIIDDIKMMHR